MNDRSPSRSTSRIAALGLALALAPLAPPLSFAQDAQPTAAPTAPAGNAPAQAAPVKAAPTKAAPAKNAPAKGAGWDAARKGKAAPALPVVKGMPGAGSQSERLAFLGLSEDQKKRIDELPREQGAWHQEHAKEIASLRDRMTEASAKGDMAALQALNAEQQQLFAARPGLDDILDAEQMKKLREHGQAQVQKRGAAAAAAGTPEIPIDVKEIERKIREARAAGDEARAQQLEGQLESLRAAVRESKAKAAGGAAAKP